MDRQEKLARRAAQQLFSKLSEGNEFVTSSMLAARIKELLQLEQGEEEADNVTHKKQTSQMSQSATLEARYGGERFVEEHMTAAATSYHQGYLPPLQHFLPPFELPTQPTSSCSSFFIRTFASISSAVGIRNRWKDTQFAIATSKLVKYLGIDLIRKMKYWYYGMSSSKVIMLLLMISCLFSVIGNDNLVSLFPVAALCISLLCMMVCTCTVLVNYKHLDEFKVWSVVLKHYCQELSTETAEKKFQNRWCVPYLGMFCALIIFLSVTPLVTNLVLCLQFPILVIFSLLATSCSLHRVGVVEHVIFALHFVASKVSILPIISEFLNLYAPENALNYFTYLSSTNIEYKIFDTLQLHIDAFSIFHLDRIITIIACLIRKGWLGTVTLLVTLIWWSLVATTFYAIKRDDDVVYASVLWLVVIIFPILWDVISIGLPSLVLLLFCFQLNVAIEITVAILISYGVSHYFLQSFLPKVFLVLRQVVFWSSITGLLLANVYKVPKTSRIALKWEPYQNMCFPSTETEAQTVVACQGFEGLLVKWQGRVTSVSITSLSNWPEYFLPVLPVPDEVKDFISCKLGEGPRNCNRTTMGLEEYERCLLLLNVLGKDRCSLENWNTYTFEVALSIDSTYWKLGKQSNNVILNASNRFSKVALALSVGEMVEFEGILSKGVGTKAPSVRVIKMSCGHCQVPTAMIDFLDQRNTTPYHLSRAVSSICNFFLGPILTMHE
uniref:Wolframin-like isoform X1 n=1 Tax=Hirondellea gigas TaxID=1518452 RepID=A0A6A7FU75_9CRUS